MRVEGGAEAVEEGDGTDLRVGPSAGPAAPQGGADGAEEDPEHPRHPGSRHLDIEDPFRPGARYPARGRLPEPRQDAGRAGFGGCRRMYR
jgi:hypothetical protein